MYRLLHIFLSLMLVWSASGLHIAKHYCMGSLRDAGWYQVDACHGGEHTQAEAQTPSDAELQFNAIPCCEDELTWIQTNETLAAAETITLPLPLLETVETLTPQHALFTQNTTIASDRAPPLIRIEDFQVAFQVFRV